MHGNIPVLQLLVKNNGLPSDNSLIFACKNGNIDIVKFLISLGDNKLDIPLVEACKNGHLSIVLYLVKKNAIITEQHINMAAIKWNYVK